MKTDISKTDIVIATSYEYRESSDQPSSVEFVVFKVNYDGPGPEAEQIGVYQYLGEAQAMYPNALVAGHLASRYFLNRDWSKADR